MWGAEAGGDHKALFTAVSRLNKKMDSAAVRVVFRRGEGYTLEEIVIAAGIVDARTATKEEIGLLMTKTTDRKEAADA